MRRLSILLVCAVSVFASQDCLAGGVPDRFDVARRNTSTAQFQQDRDACVVKVVSESARPALQICVSSLPHALTAGAGELYHGTNGHSPVPPRMSVYSGGVDLNKINTEICVARFVHDCLSAKGYVRVPEATGFPVALRWKSLAHTDSIEVRWK